MTLKKNHRFLAADTIHGVYVSEPGCTDAEVMADDLFYSCLSIVSDGETIYGMISDDMADKIKREYGIL